MKKKTVENIAKTLPSALKNVTGYFKDNFDKSGQDILGDATGTVGIFIKFFAQDTIDSYFEKLTKEKLGNYGSNVYLQASLLQVGKSIELLNDEAIQVENGQSVVTLLIDTLNDVTFDASDVLTIFTPQYHPIVVFVKEQMKKLLFDLHLYSVVVDSFTRDFNENIESTIVELFGDDYEKHKEEIEGFLFQEKESKLLWDMYELGNLRFTNNEFLKYEETYASWQSVSSVLDKEREKKIHNKEEEQKEHQELELSLQPIEELIEVYFEECTAKDSCHKNILFTIADFGKGKSVFLKHYASKLAKAYAQTKEGYFPIYFNLRNYANYSHDGTLGVLGAYLLEEYAIRIEDEEFQKKKYIFLVDSLDESGELDRASIERVISSIKSIQNIDKEKYRQNRIIITSRPFSDGMEEMLKAHNPYEIENKHKERVPQFISLYGFKEEQFNAWLYDTLKNDKTVAFLSTTGFVKEIIESIKKSESINIYQKLLDEKTLSRTELRRPIFSYMVYQLIVNNVDFLSIGKIGVYLSFINLLTKQAKHVDDKQYKVNQHEEIRYRNILHAIASLWMYERQQGKQGTLKKADICRVLDGENRQETDKQILERYKDKGVIEIEFPSHSYFGEEDNNLHFQHQSFAEILLAEYYLKVFIKYALEKQSDLNTARSKLILGEPTEQTMVFFKELLKLLKESVDDGCENVIEKRKLLYPLFASLATEENNTLYSSVIDLKWFDNDEVDTKSSRIPIELLENWAINQKQLEKIIDFSAEIIDSKTTILMAKTQTRHALFDNELTVFQNSRVSDSPTDMDKWLALVVGNLLHDDVPEERNFFNGRLEYPAHLFEMIYNYNFSNIGSVKYSIPKWASQYFKGIQIQNKLNVHLSNLRLNNINFSYSTFTNLYIFGSNIMSSNFDNCIFEDINAFRSSIAGATFNNIEILNSASFSSAILIPHVFVPYQLVYFLNSKYENNIKIKTLLFNSLKFQYPFLEKAFTTLQGLLVYGLKNNLFNIKEIKSWFDYETDKDRAEFEKLIDGLGEFEVLSMR